MGNVCERDELILHYMPLANKLARKKWSRTPKCVDYDELQSAAFMGLVEAANKYEADRNVVFGTYAVIRMCGAICDYLRSLHWFGVKNPLMPISAETPIGDESDCRISDSIEAKEDGDTETIHFFEEATKILDDLGSKVISLYYIQGLSLKEIGEDVGLCESRICQILASCRKQMKNKWNREELWSHAA